MNKLSVTLITMMIAVALLILPTAQAADIELSDACSLADAIIAANTDAAAGDCPAGDGEDTITLSGDITLRAALPHITSEITIEGEDYTISGNNRFRIFTVNAGDLTVNSLTVTKGKSYWGGAIVNVNGGTLIINDSDLKNNRASEGGAIGNDGTLHIVSSDISQNSATIGGAIYNINGSIFINNSVIINNASEDNGGAIAIENGIATLEGSVVSKNTAEGRGGAIWVGNEGLLKVIGSSDIKTNESSVNGGGIASENGTVEITHSTISRNTSGNIGGGIFCDFGMVSILDSVIDGNIAESGGGGVRGFDCPTEIVNSQIVNNIVLERGGRYLRNGGGINIIGSVAIRGTLIRGNAAERGGGVWISSKPVFGEKFYVLNSILIENIGYEEGGGLFIQEGQAIIANASVTNNSAKSGGGLYKDADAEINLINSILADNEGGDCFGRLSENIGNLIADGSCFPTLMGDPMLGELVEPEDGSPAYFPLLEGSPAIDAADSEYCPDADIIGTARPQGSGCDIGAYELPQE